MARSLAFINNKGGVGKTTLLCNMAHHLSVEEGARVLVIDLDPQCNASQLLLTTDQWAELYEDSAKTNEANTVLHALTHIRRGDSQVLTDFEPLASKRFGVDVLAGHPSMALLEDRLSSSWEDLARGDLGGARRSHWVRQMVSAVDYDYVLIDAGPSLGALNRTVLLGSDLFITPTSADMFSLFALDNIGEWYRAWLRTYTNGMQVVAEEFEDEVVALGLDPVNPKPPTAYLGYTIQQYVTKAMRDGERRNTNAYDHYSKQIPAKAKRLAERVGFPRSSDLLNLGRVPYMFAMIPLAQASHAPIFTLTTEDGLRGAQISQRARYSEQLFEIGEALQLRLKDEVTR
jgi:cellulose biosynthesis protein BcsQ